MHAPHTVVHNHHRLLLVEDDEDQLRFFSELLQNQGYQVYPVASVAEGMRLMSKIYFDLVISDCYMPERDADQFIAELRSMATFPTGSKIPIIVLSVCDANTEQRLLKLGADMFCHKYQASTLLIEQVDYLLNEQ